MLWVVRKCPFAASNHTPRLNASQPEKTLSFLCTLYNQKHIHREICLHTLYDKLMTFSTHAAVNPDHILNPLVTLWRVLVYNSILRRARSFLCCA